MRKEITVECPGCGNTDEIIFLPALFRCITDATRGKFKCKCGHEWHGLKFWRIRYRNIIVVNKETTKLYLY